MKRSRNLRLVLIAASVPVVVAGCDSEPTGTIVRSLSDCTATTSYTAQQCEEAYGKALLTHEQTAPRFTSMAECSAEFDGCQPAAAAPAGTSSSNSSHSFVPPMAGFLIGYALANQTGGGMYYGNVSPLYRNYRTGEYYNGNADYIGNRTGTVTGKAGKLAPPTRAITMSRSGFGSSSAARSSFSGGRGS